MLHRRKRFGSFKDGERLHLWVGREFKGALLLKANGKLLGRYEPARLDERRYDAQPTTKPAPLIVVMKNEPAPQPTLTAAPRTRSSSGVDTEWRQPYAWKRKVTCWPTTGPQSTSKSRQ